MNDRSWWICAIVATLGDVLTTWYGVTQAGLTEQNPIALSMFETFGVLPGIVALKVFALGVIGVSWYVVDEGEWVYPAMVAVLYGIVTILNLTQIFSIV